MKSIRNIKLGLLPQVIIAIVAGLLLGNLLPDFLIRFFVTFNGLFSQFLGFSIPLIILGLVAPGIADLGKSAGKLLLTTILLAYASTLFAGFFSYFTCNSLFPSIIGGESTPLSIQNPESGLLAPYFMVEMPPVFGVMTALLLAFVLGIGVSMGKGDVLKSVLFEFKSIIEKLISFVIVPLLPLHIFGIFLNMSSSGAAFQIITIFGKVIGVIFCIHILVLVIQFCIAGGITKQNPFRLLFNMLPAYMTALGTSSSAATIPVTLAQVRKIGVNEDIADFCVPLCATIHLSGSTLKIVGMSLAVCIINGLPHDLQLYSGFIMMLGIMMIAAPGVPGGAIMAATGLLHSTLHFNDESVGLMIALYIAIDSFGTACNVTGDGAIAIIVDHLFRKKTKENVNSFSESTS